MSKQREYVKSWRCPSGSVTMSTAGSKGFVIQATSCPYAIFKDDYTDANVTFTGQVNLIRGREDSSRSALQEGMVQYKNVLKALANE